MRRYARRSTPAIASIGSGGGRRGLDRRSCGRARRRVGPRHLTLSSVRNAIVGVVSIDRCSSDRSVRSRSNGEGGGAFSGKSQANGGAPCLIQRNFHAFAEVLKPLSQVASIRGRIGVGGGRGRSEVGAGPVRGGRTPDGLGRIAHGGRTAAARRRAGTVFRSPGAPTPRGRARGRLQAEAAQPTVFFRAKIARPGVAGGRGFGV